MWMQSNLKSVLRLFKGREGFTLSEVILALVISSVVLLVISGIYNFQTKFFNKMLSAWQINDDISVALATFKRYTTLGKEVVSCSPNEVRIKIEENGGEKEVYWRFNLNGELFYAIVPVGGGYGSETLLTDLLLPSKSGFESWIDSDTNISGITVKLTLRDKYGQEGRRISKYRLILTGGGG